MADSVYISKNLDAQQLQFMKLLDAHEILYFNMYGIEQQFGQRFKNLNEVLENLVDKELLTRLQRGHYAKSNYNNTNALATFISKDGVLGYWSALHYHGLTERFPNTTFVKTTQRKRDTAVLGTNVQFVTVKATKQLGIAREGYGYDSFPITDVEMTLIDCFDQPRYSGGFDDAVAAFARCPERIDGQAELSSTKLIDYCIAYDSMSLIKRLGFLASLFHPDELKEFITYALGKVNERYTLMDAGGLDKGKFVNEWKLRLNVSKDELIQMAATSY